MSPRGIEVLAQHNTKKIKQSKTARSLHLVLKRKDVSAANLSQPPTVPTVFHEEWWLQAATQGRHSIAEVFTGGKPVGRLPYLMRSRQGVHGIWTPPLTYYLGPGVDEGEGGSSERFLRRLEITRELIARLPRSSWQCIRCHGGTKEVVAFQEQHFRTYLQFTHEIRPAPVESLWLQIRNPAKQAIRKAEQRVVVEELGDPDEFIRVHEQNRAAEGQTGTIDLGACRRVLSAALARKQGRVLAARNSKREIVAANFCAWDNKVSFHILSTQRGVSGGRAKCLLIWEAIQHAAKKDLVFDFTGSDAPGSARLYADFGASVSPRFVAARAAGIGPFRPGSRAGSTQRRRGYERAFLA